MERDGSEPALAKDSGQGWGAEGSKRESGLQSGTQLRFHQVSGLQQLLLQCAELCASLHEQENVSGGDVSYCPLNLQSVLGQPCLVAQGREAVVPSRNPAGPHC